MLSRKQEQCSKVKVKRFEFGVEVEVVKEMNQFGDTYMFFP